jgi:hypothetical protein
MSENTYIYDFKIFNILVSEYHEDCTPSIPNLNISFLTIYFLNLLSEIKVDPPRRSHSPCWIEISFKSRNIIRARLWICIYFIFVPFHTVSRDGETSWRFQQIRPYPKSISRELSLFIPGGVIVFRMNTPFIRNAMKRIQCYIKFKKYLTKTRFFIENQTS